MKTDPKQEQKTPVELGFEFQEFSGGMRRNVEPGYLKDNEYPLLVNGRSRYGSIRPIKLPRQLASINGSNFQTIFSWGEVLFAYVDGRCFHMKPFVETDNFREIYGASLDRFAETIYTEVVPDSSYDFDRQPVIENSAGEVHRTIAIEGSDNCAICQDGINRPIAIAPNIVARTLGDFKDWNKDGIREYVPIGRNMLYHDGILYIVSPDYAEIYRSVTGRPLDFVVAIGEGGDKLSDSLFTVEAARMSHKVSNNPITCIGTLNVSPAFPQFGTPFFASTTKGTFKVTPDFSTTFFAEPTYKNIGLFNTSILNQNAYTFSSGDIQFIDWLGFRSFNAVEQTLVVSKDTALSGPIFKLFEGVNQTVSCCAYFDDYTLFGCQTIYGPAVVVYDNLLQKFSAIDVFEGVGQIKKFVIVEKVGLRKLFFMTSTGVYEYFGSTTTASCKVYLKECSPPKTEYELKLLRAKLSFNNVEEDGTVSATPYADRVKEETLTLTVEKNFNSSPGFDTIPIGDPISETVEERTFNFQDSRMCCKLGLFIEFDFMADFEGIQVHAKNILSTVSQSQQISVYNT